MFTQPLVLLPLWVASLFGAPRWYTRTRRFGRVGGVGFHRRPLSRPVQNSRRRVRELRERRLRELRDQK